MRNLIKEHISDMLSEHMCNSDDPIFYTNLASRLKREGKYRMIRRTLPDGSKEDYLERFYVHRGNDEGIYIHRFWSGDEDPVHDHPWDNYSKILIGGYWEYLPDGHRFWRAPEFEKFRTAEEFHRIELDPEVPEVWSLFVRFQRRRKWGFWHPDGWREATFQGGE